MVCSALQLFSRYDSAALTLSLARQYLTILFFHTNQLQWPAVYRCIITEPNTCHLLMQWPVELEHNSSSLFLQHQKVALVLFWPGLYTYLAIRP